MRNYAPLTKGARELGRAFAMAPAIEKKAENDSMANALTSALSQAKINKYDSDTALNNKRLTGMDEGRQIFMQGATGLNQPQLSELAQAMEEGWQTTQAAGPPTPTGDVPLIEQQPNWYTPEVKDRYNQASMAMGANMAGTGKTNGEQLVDTMQGAINIGRQDQIISGQADPNPIAAAMAATAGKPTVDVTGSGIAFNPYGSKTDLNTQPYEQAAQIRAKATVDAALARNKVNGGQLPAEAKLIKFYMDELKYPKEQAIEMAKSRKYLSLRDLAMDAYMEARKMRAWMPPPEGISDDQYDAWLDQQAEQDALKMVEFMTRNRSSFEGNGGNNDPMGLRQ